MPGPSTVFCLALVRPAEAHVGSQLCRHCLRTKTGLSGFFPFENRLRTVNAPGEVSRFVSKTLSLEKETSGLGNPFCSLHASSQLRQPMHFVVSTSNPSNSTLVTAAPD